ncbi:MAG: putative Ig domain-containing protein, partial [Acidobacteria bacterium]|nr:putative Ig domain-containing protein [Acidobacteriota bacterium]
MALSTGGAITGTPIAAGTASFTVQVTDSDSASQPATQALQIVINPPPTITTTSLPAGTVGVAYSQSLAAAGGTPPYAWVVTASSLPQGLALSTGGAITGTPNTAGTASFTVQVTDSTSLSATQALQIVINPAPTPPTITTTSLPAGTVGVAYSQSLAAAGGTPP